MFATTSSLSILAAAIPMGLLAGGLPQGDGGPTGAFHYSKDAGVAAEQRKAKAVVEAYQRGLNRADYPAIRRLFAPGAVSEWNGKATGIGIESMERPYARLFREIEFKTDFQYDAVELHGPVAIVRTHHPVGQMEVSRKDGTKTLDLNREVFVLSKESGAYRIVLYTFTTQPKQGVQ